MNLTMNPHGFFSPHRTSTFFPLFLGGQKCEPSDNLQLLEDLGKKPQQQMDDRLTDHQPGISPSFTSFGIFFELQGCLFWGGRGAVARSFF